VFLPAPSHLGTFGTAGVIVGNWSIGVTTDGSGNCDGGGFNTGAKSGLESVKEDQSDGSTGNEGVEALIRASDASGWAETPAGSAPGDFLISGQPVGNVLWADNGSASFQLITNDGSSEAGGQMGCHDVSSGVVVAGYVIGQ